MQSVVDRIVVMRCMTVMSHYKTHSYTYRYYQISKMTISVALELHGKAWSLFF